MSVTVLIGTQWGDEGKGKVTDVMAEEADLVVRYQGGNNAGHTVVVGDATFKLHLIPSGILYEACVCVIGNGVVLDPEVFFSELEALAERGISISPDRLRVSRGAHVILPLHRMLDRRQEEGRKDQKIGTTGRGIGPCYTDKISRQGIRVQDLLDEGVLRQRLNARNWPELLQQPGLDLDLYVAESLAFGQRLAPYMEDTSLFVNQAIKAGKSIILEGAQGTMLDVDHGTYPFVTSSNPTSGGACIGAGIGPTQISEVLGVCKAYLTRVGEGPFPTELNDATGDFLRTAGFEFGTTTGRPRRCGWLDLVGLRYAIRVNGITQLCITKLDVLNDLSEIQVCTHYQAGSQKIEEFPMDIKTLNECRPVYEKVAGWQSDISGITAIEELPENAMAYIRYIEAATGVPVTMISVGTRRDQIIRRRPQNHGGAAQALGPVCAIL